MDDEPPRPAQPELRVSVVIPTHERPVPLLALLESLAAETLARGAFEVVIADDGSGPAIAAIADRFAARFASFRFVTGENAGPGVARNRGVAAASAPILAFTDSDCLVRPGWLEALIAPIEAGAAA